MHIHACSTCFWGGGCGTGLVLMAQKGTNTSRLISEYWITLGTYIINQQRLSLTVRICNAG